MSTEPSSKQDAIESDRPVSVQTPDSALRQPVQLARDIARDLWAGRELAWRMFLRNIRALYRQSFLGLFWAFLPPLANTAVWVVLRGASAIAFEDTLPPFADKDNFTYAVYVMTGMVIWQSFIEALQAPLQAVQANRNMLSKLKFPRESILLVRFFEVMFNLCVRTAVLIPLLLILPSEPFNTGMLWAPLLVIVLIILGFAIGLFLMPLGMLYQDVSRAIAIALPVWMIITPIIYLPPQGWVSHPLNYLNPASPLLSTARDLLVFGDSLYWGNIWFYAAIAIPMLLVGLVLFRLSIPVLVERIST